MFARSRPAPFAVSLMIHGAILAWVAVGPMHESKKTLYRETIAPHASKLVWYDFRAKLPEVTPRRASETAKAAGAEEKMAQQIRAVSQKPDPAHQLVWQPAPKLELHTDLQSPNVLAMRAVRPEPPPKPKLFVPPKAPQPTGAAAVLAAPQEIQMARTVHGAANAPGMQPVKAPPRTFVAPRANRPAQNTAAPLPDAPVVAAAANPSTAPRLLSSGTLKADPREFVAPAARAKASPVNAVPEPPPLAATQPAATASMAIVALKPSASAPPPMPPGSRSAEFSASPQPHAPAAPSSTADNAILTVPELFIHSESPDSKSALIARASPTSAASLRAAMRSSLPAGPSTALPEGAIRVTTPPDPMWHGRDAYAMAVQMPNVSSYTGSWMIWFAERDVGARGALTLPVPLHKVDPKYFPAAIADRVEGKVRLIAVIRKDGSVTSIQLLQALDDRLDQSAQEAMDQWKFEPARRDGEPVDMDALIEIPFRLAPKGGK